MTRGMAGVTGSGGGLDATFGGATGAGFGLATGTGLAAGAGLTVGGSAGDKGLGGSNTGLGGSGFGGGNRVTTTGGLGFWIGAGVCANQPRPCQARPCSRRERTTTPSQRQPWLGLAQVRPDSSGRKTGVQVGRSTVAMTGLRSN